MNPLRKALATLLEAARALPLLAAGLVLAGPAAATADPGVPPVVLTNVVVQKYGEEANWEPLPEGTLFWRTGDPWTPDGLYIADGETPGGRAVCVGRADYHSFTNTVKVNGHRVELNDQMSLQAESYAVLFRCGTNTLLRISAAKASGFVRYTVQSYSPTGMVIQANVSAGAFVEVTTDLLDASSWTAATNATVLDSTGESTTWSIDFLDADAQFYRVAYPSDTPVDVAITAELPFLANAGLVIPEGQTLRMGSNTWTELPDVGTIATNAADAAVSPVAVRVGTLEPIAATHATKTELAAATNTLAESVAETYATAANLAAVAGLAATNAGNIYSNSANLTSVTNAFGQRISEFEEVNLVVYREMSTTDANIWEAPTNLPTRCLNLHICATNFTSTNYPLTIRIPSELQPTRPTTIRFLLSAVTGNTRLNYEQGTTRRLSNYAPASSQRQIELHWLPEVGAWQYFHFQLQASHTPYTRTGVNAVGYLQVMPKSIESWIAWRNQQPW